jgi:hypothetical protein
MSASVAPPPRFHCRCGLKIIHQINYDLPCLHMPSLSQSRSAQSTFMSPPDTEIVNFVSTFQNPMSCLEITNLVLSARANSLQTFRTEVSIAILTSSGRDIDKKLQVATSDDFVNVVQPGDVDLRALAVRATWPRGLKQLHICCH